MFGEQIREARLKAGLSEAKLCRQAGINRTQLRLLERDRNVALSTLIKVVAQLPELTHLRLRPAAPLPMMDTNAVRDVVAEIESSLGRLREMMGDNTGLRLPLETGESYQTASGLPPEVEQQVRENDAAIDAGTVRAEWESVLGADEGRELPKE